MMKKFNLVTVFLIIISIVAGCSNTASTNSLTNIKMPYDLSIDNVKKFEENKETTNKKEVKVAIALSTGGKGDKSFNDSALRGLDKAARELGVTYVFGKGETTDKDYELLKSYAEEGKDLIIGVGFLLADPVLKAAKEYPNVKFAIIDLVYEEIPENVVCISFKEEEGSFLAGLLAAGLSKSKVIGFVGGMESPLIEKFDAGFIQGAKALNPEIKVLSQYVGKEPDAFNNPEVSYDITKTMVSQGADIVYHASGGSGTGVFKAAKESGILSIGVDSNQNWSEPGTIVASMEKRIDIAVFTIVKDIYNDSFTGGTARIFGIKENGVALSDLTNLTVEETDGMSKENIEKIKALKESIPEELKKSINDYKTKIADGEVVISDTILK